MLATSLVAVRASMDQPPSADVRAHRAWPLRSRGLGRVGRRYTAQPLRWGVV